MALERTRFAIRRIPDPPTPVTDAELLQAIGFAGTSNGNAYQRHMHHLTLLALQELQKRRAHQPTGDV